jgi:hypothetical protein
MMPLVFDREFFRRPVAWFIVAGSIAAAICLICNVVAYRHDHGRLTPWFFVGIGLLLASQLTAIAARRTDPQ